MRNRLFIICLFTYQISAFGISNEINLKFSRILKDLDSTIKNSNTRNQTLETHYDFIINKIRNNEIDLVYDSTLNYSFRGCASSNISLNDSLKYSLSIGKFILDVYETFPFLVQGIIIHEFQHLYDFSTNRALIEISKKNQIEHAYFEIDALYLEVLFFKNCTYNQNNRSPIEKYLIIDFDKNLDGSAILFEKVDLTLLHQIDAIKDKNISFKDGQKEYIRIGKELCKKIKFSDNKWNNYCNLITLKTYTYHSRQILHDLLFNLDHKAFNDDQLDIKEFSDFNEIVLKVQKIIKDNNEYFNYYDETMAMYDNYFNKKIKK